MRFGYSRDRNVLDIADLSIPIGSRTFLHGPSGSGKTTLLGLLAGVLQAKSGTVEVLGTDLTGLSGSRRDAFRASHIGYVFQMFNLIPYLSVLDNILLATRISSARRGRLQGREPRVAARELAERLEIDSLLSERVTQLSVGQQQRVAACRALIGAPEILIADEPTSALDQDRRTAFLDLLFDACAERATTLVFVSHDRTLEPLFEHHLSLGDLNRAVN